MNTEFIICSSDRELKENIQEANFDKKIAANNVIIREFNFKDDPNKGKVYGIIAQELEEKGLSDIVYLKEDGHKAVDYTSLSMLKIAYLENENKILRHEIRKLADRISKLENNQNK
jgi:hypothetical protein